MKVRATQLGYYGNKRVYEGEVFELTDKKQFSKKWMEEVEPGQKAESPKAAQKPSDKDKAVI